MHTHSRTYLEEEPTLLMEAPSVRRSRWSESSRSRSLMSDSLRREVVEGGDRWSVEGLVDADSVSTYMLRRCGGERSKN